MTAADEPKFSALIQALVETYQGKFTPGLLLGYRMGLADLPIEQIETAVARAMRSPNGFAPKPGELRAMAGADTAALRAARAWATVVDGIRKHGYTGGLDARGDNGLTHAVVRAMGGWGALCRTATEGDTWLAKKFCDLYEAMGMTVMGEYQRRPLLGESGNARVLWIGGLDERRALPAVEAKALARP